MNSKAKKSRLKQKLTNRYRLVVFNEQTFEERFALKLSRLNVYVLGALFSFLLILLTFLLVAYTPIKQYIPRHSSLKLKTDATKLTLTSDSLQNRVAILENYTKSIKSILTGEVISDYGIDSIQEQAKRVSIDENSLNASKQDSLFREKIESRDRFPLSGELNKKVKVVFFAPISGTVSQSFNPKNNHFAIDVVAKTGTPVKAISHGTVIFSEWTAETGYVIILKHTDNFISVYKHNQMLLKHQGDLVQSGEAIARVGSSGELTTGPHLHFELWSDGYAVNPANYIDFE